jgi:outer membrane lipoprotein LolB
MIRIAVGWPGWLLAAVLMAGCASPPPKTAEAVSAETGPWSGRLALQVEDRQSQSFSASFQLKGDARAGELTLSLPLGGTLAVLAWAPGSATLRTNGRAVQEFESVEELVAQATGAALPVTALFDWLRGTNTPVAGWQADLSQLENGRLRAQRLHPTPPADLRVVLDR